MKKRIPLIAAALAIAVAVAGVMSASKASKEKSEAEEEARNLRQQLVWLQGDLDKTRDGTHSTPRATFPSGTINTNDIDQLKALLARKDAELEALALDLATKQENQRPKRESFEERIAKMKAEDPEGYAEMVQKRQEFQQKMRYNLAERTATFMDLDTSTMTAEERENHELLVEKMANVWELTAQFQDPEAAPDREAMRELFTEINAVRPLMDQERTVMFKQLGSELGYEGEDADAFATHVEDIIGATSLQMPRGGGGRGGRGGGGR